MKNLTYILIKFVIYNLTILTFSVNESCIEIIIVTLVIITNVFYLIFHFFNFINYYKFKFKCYKNNI